MATREYSRIFDACDGVVSESHEAMADSDMRNCGMRAIFDALRSLLLL